ncbi:family 1 glycosylhydrolase [Mesorhizobium sp. SARCC-RB16n]|uniref:family 1 glycosylhydrolase n=1 Tax=Mesorhizobium sp. SARCC-RB16n TaxID=2116687 RepID=UPI001FEF9629|nr:family 1 glycosylhydrolase [Mesorhizobium sp. SARCC-RB16n]
MFTFVFATAIENSAPTIKGGRERVDEMEKCRFYEQWRTDFELVQDLGLRFLRYGPPIHKSWLGDGHYDWTFADETFSDLKTKDIVPIVDLCHFGVPDWVGNFQNPDFPRLFEGYAHDFATRFPWIQLYTPVNEMFIRATFSARWGWWNEQLSTDAAFVTALKHSEGQSGGYASDPAGAAGRDLYSERILGVLPRRLSRGDRQGGALQQPAFPIA